MGERSISKCTNCGGELTFNPDTNVKKCDYCGSEFKVAPNADGTESDSAMISFKIQRADFKAAMLKWLAAGKDVPANIISGSLYGPVVQAYIPVYYIKGKCTGEWTSYLKPNAGFKKYLPSFLKGEREKVSGGQISEDFTIVSLACDNYKSTYVMPPSFYVEYFKTNGVPYQPSEDNHPLFDLLTGYQVNENNVIPSDERVSKSTDAPKFELSKDESWDRFGQKQVSRKLSQKIISQQQEPQAIDVAVNAKYDITSTGKVYLPFWMTKNVYGSEEYNICMDGVSGNISGEKIFTDAAVVSKNKIYNKALLAGLGISLALYLYRFNLPDGKMNLNQHNNPLFSPMGGFWWFVRVILLWGVLPKFVSDTIYKKKVNSAQDKLTKAREIELERVNTGQLELKHWNGIKAKSQDDVNNDEEDYDDGDDIVENLDPETEAKFQDALSKYGNGKN
ncbi:hypothetical protein [Mucilaginibacter sp. KACC 22063]|uniref:hypothetical protein n=1 Tax=Mucilaginibacter sp. KACC 22063 TaxID=3025666 RepID=UPI0023667FE2|nr:hypothetical protein [Mucilaginibacter sp. KACC 22063]WDF55451.1 hypothetical protein PQ461_00065 [Mucilaginibacter sp. KACC 22063]